MASRQPNETALLIYTGGTTGCPKGVLHSHRSVTNWFHVNPSAGFGYARDQKAIGFNIAHLTGQSVIWMTMAAGGCVYFLEQYPPRLENVLQLIEAEHITHLGTVGQTLKEILKLVKCGSYHLTSLKIVTCGGAPISITGRGPRRGGIVRCPGHISKVLRSIMSMKGKEILFFLSTGLVLAT